MDHIPTHVLQHENENVFFAFRTVEENHLKEEAHKSVPHRHDFYTIILVKNAEGSHFIDYEEHKLSSQIAFFVSPGQVHQVIIENDNPSGDILMFNQEFLTRNYISEDFISNLGMFSCGVNTPPLCLPKESFDKLSYWSNQINQAFNENSAFKFDIIASNLKLFLIECNRHSIQSMDKNPQNIQSGRPIIKQFKDLLEKHFTNWHKANEYAAAMNITPDYLNNVLKTNIGKTTKEMIFQRIILEAKRLGLHTSSSNKEIAYQLGYEDPSHFSRIFKKETNQSFTAFRKDLELQLTA